MTTPAAGRLALLFKVGVMDVAVGLTPKRLCPTAVAIRLDIGANGHLGSHPPPGSPLAHLSASMALCSASIRAYSSGVWRGRSGQSM